MNYDEEHTQFRRIKGSDSFFISLLSKHASMAFILSAIGAKQQNKAVILNKLQILVFRRDSSQWYTMVSAKQLSPTN